MRPIAILSALLAMVAAALAATSTARASQLWLVVMIGAAALTCGSIVSLWAEPNAPKFTRRGSAKVIFGAVAAILLLPALLAGFALFTFTLMPALVIILPLIAGWDFGALRRVPPVHIPVPLVPRHA
jgi:hypothetical protein